MTSTQGLKSPRSPKKAAQEQAIQDEAAEAFRIISQGAGKHYESIFKTALILTNWKFALEQLDLLQTRSKSKR